ncbi:hypothetical protein BH24ACI3_BH24ACI3_00510 [soil metagenome]
MPKNHITEVLDLLYRQAQIQFGDAVKSRWFYDGDGCPGCGRDISPMKYKKKKAMSLNAFMYREKGVLIGYLLCGKCASLIHDTAAADQYTDLPVHAEIEENLKKAFVKHLGH